MVRHLFYFYKPDHEEGDGALTWSITPKEGPVITIGGLHGVGKSTYGMKLAATFGLTYVSTGMIFRKLAKESNLSITELSDLSSKDPSLDLKIDDMTKEMLARGNVLFDSLLASYFAKDYESFRIYLRAPYEVRVMRIANRDGKKEGESEQETLFRERLELDRFKRYYGIDMSDTSICHLILDTSLLTIEANLKILTDAIACYLRERWSEYVRDDAWKDMRKDTGKGQG